MEYKIEQEKQSPTRKKEVETKKAKPQKKKQEERARKFTTTPVRRNMVFLCQHPELLDVQVTPQDKEKIRQYAKGVLQQQQERTQQSPWRLNHVYQSDHGKLARL